MKKRNTRKTVKFYVHNKKLFFGILVAIIVPSIAVLFYSLQLVFGAAAQVTEQASLPAEFLNQYGLGLLSASIAVGGSCLGAGIAIYGAASAGAAAIAERPETSIWVLILAGLGEGVAIYGLLIAIIILSKLPAIA